MRLPTLRLLAVIGAISLGACAGGVKAGGNGWDANAKQYRGQNGVRYSYVCPANGSPGNLWGTDTYTDDSSVCTAAVHFGTITLAQGGNVVVEIRPGAASYTGSERNGAKSTDYGSWGGSYIIVRP